jgi:hypothetical protein
MIVASAYAAMIIVLGLLPGILLQSGGGCEYCPKSALDRRSQSGGRSMTRIGLWLGIVFISAFVLVLVVDHLRSSAAARARADSSPRRARSISRSWRRSSRPRSATALFGRTTSNDGCLARPSGRTRRPRVGRRLELGAGAPQRSSSSEARGRARAQAPPPGGLRHALAAIVGDPALELAYPREESDRLRPAGPTAHLSPKKEQTTLVGGGRRLAVVAHEPGALGDEQLVDEIAVTAACTRE